MPNACSPHVLIVPEDAACRDVANGFVQGVDRVRAVRVEKPRKGWTDARDALACDAFKMKDTEERRLVLVVDFDNQQDCAHSLRKACHADWADRVYVVGAIGEVEVLRRSLVNEGLLQPNTLEGIGRLLADDCRHQTDSTWSHPMLAHNTAEYKRMRTDLRQILFDT